MHGSSIFFSVHSIEVTIMQHLSRLQICKFPATRSNCSSPALPRKCRNWEVFSGIIKMYKSAVDRVCKRNWFQFPEKSLVQRNRLKVCLITLKPSSYFMLKICFWLKIFWKVPLSATDSSCTWPMDRFHLNQNWTRVSTPSLPTSLPKWLTQIICLSAKTLSSTEDSSVGKNTCYKRHLPQQGLKSILALLLACYSCIHESVSKVQSCFCHM